MFRDNVLKGDQTLLQDPGWFPCTEPSDTLFAIMLWTWAWTSAGALGSAMEPPPHLLISGPSELPLGPQRGPEFRTSSFALWCLTLQVSFLQKRSVSAFALQLSDRRAKHSIRSQDLQLPLLVCIYIAWSCRRVFPWRQESDWGGRRRRG